MMYDDPYAVEDAAHDAAQDQAYQEQLLHEQWEEMQRADREEMQRNREIQWRRVYQQWQELGQIIEQMKPGGSDE